jgi:Fic/DOC family
MNTVKFISAHVPSYDQITMLRPDVVGFIDETWRLIAERKITDCRDAAKRLSVTHLHIDTAEAKFLRKLRHPLSTRALVRAGTLNEAPNSPEQHVLFDSKIDERNSSELNALKKFERELLISLSCDHVDHFAHLLERIATEFHGSIMKLRSTAAFIVPDAHGVGWHCPPSSEIILRLTELHQYIANNANRSPLQTAIVSLVMLSCIHPFMDGNGRLSRIVFHAILRKFHSHSELYIPLKNFYAASAFGFEIRLRHTFLTSDWAEIMVYFCNVLRFSRRYTASSIGQRDKRMPYGL